MPALVLTLEKGMYGMLARPLAGALWRASFYDVERGQFYAGSADDPFEAIAWALFEREERIANDEHPTPTKASNETPVQALARLRERPHVGNLQELFGRDRVGPRGGDQQDDAARSRAEAGRKPRGGSRSRASRVRR